EHYALVSPRRLLPRLPETPSGVESGIRARAHPGLGENGRSRPPSRWRRGAPDRRLASAMTRTADVVIVGGGVTGVSIAFHLAGRGIGRAVLVDRKSCASGVPVRSVGIVRQLYPTPETTKMVRRSLEVFQHFGDAVGGHAGYTGCGVLIGVSPTMRPQLEKTLTLQRTLGVCAQLLEPSDVARVDARIDATGLGAVLYEPESGYGHPVGVTSGYADAARRRGVVIEQGVEVVAIATARSRVTGVVTAAGERIEAPVVVNTGGLWSPAIAALAGVTLPIVIGRHPVFIVERDAGFGAPPIVYLDLAGGSSVGPGSGGPTLPGAPPPGETQTPMGPRLRGARGGPAT